MCKSIKYTLLSALFAFCLAEPLSSQSVKESIIEQLSACQTKLQMVNQSIESYKINIASLQGQIANLSQQLTDSKEDLYSLNLQLESSRLDLEALKKQLEACKQLLTDSEADLKKQAEIYETLSKDLERLKTSLALYRNSTKILGGACIVMGGYIGGHIAGLW